MLQDTRVVAAAKACLQRVHILCKRRHRQAPQKLPGVMVNVRAFLAGFMIAFKPSHVFESMGPVEGDLQEAAVSVITRFEKICNAIGEAHHFHALPLHVTDGFAQSLLEYLQCFKAWKKPDEEKHIRRITDALNGLYQAMEQLSNFETEESKLSLHYRSEIERLRSKMRVIAGTEALQAYDEARRNGRTGVSDAAAATGDRVRQPNGIPRRLTNEQLAHELLLNPLFQLEVDGRFNSKCLRFRHVRETFLKVSRTWRMSSSTFVR